MSSDSFDVTCLIQFTADARIAAYECENPCEKRYYSSLFGKYMFLIPNRKDYNDKNKYCLHEDFSLINGKYYRSPYECIDSEILVKEDSIFKVDNVDPEKLLDIQWFNLQYGCKIIKIMSSMTSREILEKKKTLENQIKELQEKRNAVEYMFNNYEMVRKTSAK